MGSISIDELLLTAVGIIPYEQVQVVNVNNGERFITYAIAAAAGSGSIELNGAAARLGLKGDKLIIMTYAQFSEAEAQNHQPRVVIVDDLNQFDCCATAKCSGKQCKPAAVSHWGKLSPQLVD